MYPLYDEYPALERELPRLPLADLPTPIMKADALAAEFSAGAVFVKRDDLTAAEYGGNKVRKLELLLGEAQRQGARTVITFGAAGSNHALATAIYAGRAGMRAISLLVPQPNAHSVRKNLLLSHAAGAELHHCLGVKRVALKTAWLFQQCRLREGRFPVVIPPGGSSPLGAASFVNAAFELRGQIAAGEMPVPDLIYVASGTMGTCIGLLLGLRAAGLPSHVVAARVTDPQFTSERKGRRLYEAVNVLLHNAASDFPVMPYPVEQFTLEHGYFGEKYALYTPESVAAVRLAREAAGLKLDGAYTGKAFAAMAAAGAAKRFVGKTVLFWSTYNSQAFSERAKHVDYRNLPESFHRYFEDEVQPLDQAPGSA